MLISRDAISASKAAMNIKEIVKDNRVNFFRYRQGVMYYTVKVPGHDKEHMFPVPLSDVGDATLHAQEKAIIFMRYIRKAIEDGTLVPASADRHGASHKS
jgi:hypothetical protein